jgi:catechol 2,3-dioxygenase
MMTMAATTPLSIGAVSLTVHDLDLVSGFYEKAIGLQLLHSEPKLRRLGAGGAVLLELREDKAAARCNPRDAGLFHTAFLLPSLTDLGSWMKHAAGNRLQLHGASDHLVSEAIYLADPEGNGIEIYADREPALWKWQNGLVEMPSNPLNIEALVKSAEAKRWEGVPEGSIIGHVHLHVGAI